MVGELTRFEWFVSGPALRRTAVHKRAMSRSFRCSRESTVGDGQSAYGETVVSRETRDKCHGPHGTLHDARCLVDERSLLAMMTTLEFNVQPWQFILLTLGPTSYV